MLDAHAVLGDEELEARVLFLELHAKVVDALGVDLPAAALVHLRLGPHVRLGEDRATGLVDLAGGRLDALGVVIVAPEPVDLALGEDLGVAGADRQLDAARRERVEDVGGQLALGHEVEPPAVVDAVGHAHGLEVGLARVLAGVGRGEAVDEADAGVLVHEAGRLGAAIGRHGQAVRDRDVVLHGLRAVEVAQVRVPDAVLVALVGLHDGLVEGEPAADLFPEARERLGRVVGVRLDDLAVLPPAATEEIGRHVEVVQVHEALEARGRGVGEEVVVVLLALGVDVAVGVEQAAPLDRGAETREAQVLEDLEVLVVTAGEVVTAVGSDAVVERVELEVAPKIPHVLELAAALPLPFRLGAGHRRAEEEILRERELLHRSSFPCCLPYLCMLAFLVGQPGMSDL